MFTEKVIILIRYLNFVNMLYKKLALKLFIYSTINEYAITLEKSRQLYYRTIYSLNIIKLETFRTYIKIN